jgi:hypothetical protein
MTKLFGALLCAVVLAAVGCAAQPIYQVTGAPITTTSGKTPSMQQVQTAIQQAGTQLGWQLTAEKPGLMTGRLAVRTHQAVVAIEYDTKQYSIKYKDSVDLQAKDGTIHKNYNGWVQNLDQRIRAQFNLI